MAAVEAGADALGFMFYRASPRSVANEVVAEIIRELPPFVAKVGVFVNADPDSIKQAVVQCGLDTLQFHGDESPSFCREFGVKVIKAFRIRDENSLAALTPYDRESWLLDSYVLGQLGGTGETFNWELAQRAVKLGSPVILAGGLTPENVSNAVRIVRPYGVDVSSGVESAQGKKDHTKVRDFIAAAKG